MHKQPKRWGPHSLFFARFFKETEASWKRQEKGERRRDSMKADRKESGRAARGGDEEIRRKESQERRRKREDKQK